MKSNDTDEMSNSNPIARNVLILGDFAKLLTFIKQFFYLPTAAVVWLRSGADYGYGLKKNNLLQVRASPSSSRSP